MSEEILSPPYPSIGSTAHMLYGYLKELRKWVYHYRDALNQSAGQELIPAVLRIPRPEAYINQPVPTQWSHWLTMRRTREEWDHLVRCYEDCWDSAACARQQAMIVQHAAVTLNHAFTPQEVRELHQQREQEELARAFERLTEHFRRVMEPESREKARDLRREGD